MKNLRNCFFAASACVFAQFASAGTITFDTPSSGWNTVYDTAQVDVTFQGAVPWGSGYNDLTNVAYSNSTLTIDFVAQGGASATLDRFDLGNYFGSGGNLTYTVYDLANPGSALFSSPTSIAYTTASHPTYNVGRSSTTGIELVLSGDIYDNAIDNVVFSSDAATPPVPEPVNAVMFGLGLGALALAARRRQNRQG